MRSKLFILSILALALAGCTNDLEYVPEEASDAMLLTARFSALEDLHTVYLGISKTQILDAVNGGNVKCYVNGNLVADKSAESVNSLKQSIFTFPAELNVGDEVTLVATGSGYEVSSIVTVPQKPIMNSIDTASYDVSAAVLDTLLTFNLFSADVTVTDIDNDSDGLNYYMLQVFYNYAVDTLDVDLNPIRVKEGRRLCQSTYFSNSDFKGGKTTQNVLANCALFAPQDTVVADSVIINSTISVELSTVSREEYLYTQSEDNLMSSAMSSGLDPSTFSSGLELTEKDEEDMMDMYNSLTTVSLPNNIEGGYGLFSIRNTVQQFYDWPVVSYGKAKTTEEDAGESSGEQ